MLTARRFGGLQFLFAKQQWLALPVTPSQAAPPPYLKILPICSTSFLHSIPAYVTHCRIETMRFTFFAFIALVGISAAQDCYGSQCQHHYQIFQNC